MFVVDHHSLHRFQTHPDYVVNFIETLVGGGLALGLLQVELQILDGPLATVLIVVVGRLLGNSDIGQVNEHVLALVRVVRILLDAEPSETEVVEVHF